MEKKDCFGKMEVGVTPCKTCKIETKIECFNKTLIEVYGTPEECTEREKRRKCSSGLDCEENSVPPEMVEACHFLGDISLARKEKCKNFGTLNINLEMEKIKECSICSKERYMLCEIAESNLRKFPNLESNSKIKSEFEDEIYRMKGDGSCFGIFEFDKDDCFKECDFKIACLRETGIKPPPTFEEEEMPKFHPNCKKFPNFNIIEEIHTRKKEGGKFPDFLEETCDKCPMKSECLEFIKEVRTWIEKRENARKIFTDFYSLRKIRSEIMVGG